MRKPNQDLRDLMAESGVTCGMVSDRLGCSENTFWRYLRHPLPAEREGAIRRAIADCVAEEVNGDAGKV